MQKINPSPFPGRFKLVVAAESALGFQSGEFMRAYWANISAGTVTTLEASPVAQAMITFMSARKDMAGRSQWTGTATKLLALLTPKTDDQSSRSASAWPRSGRAMISALTRLAPVLRRVGIEVEYMERLSHHQPAASASCVESRRNTPNTPNAPRRPGMRVPRGLLGPMGPIQHAPTRPTRPEQAPKSRTKTMPGPMGRIGPVPPVLFTIRTARSSDADRHPDRDPDDGDSPSPSMAATWSQARRRRSPMMSVPGCPAPSPPVHGGVDLRLRSPHLLGHLRPAADGVQRPQVSSAATGFESEP